MTTPGPHRKTLNLYLISQETLLVILLHLRLRDGAQPGFHLRAQLLLGKVLFQQIISVLQVAALPFFKPLYGLSQQFG